MSGMAATPYVKRNARQPTQVDICPPPPSAKVFFDPKDPSGVDLDNVCMISPDIDRIDVDGQMRPSAKVFSDPKGPSLCR